MSLPKFSSSASKTQNTTGVTRFNAPTDGLGRQPRYLELIELETGGFASPPCGGFA